MKYKVYVVCTDSKSSKGTGRWFIGSFMDYYAALRRVESYIDENKNGAQEDIKKIYVLDENGKKMMKLRLPAKDEE